MDHRQVVYLYTCMHHVVPPNGNGNTAWSPMQALFVVAAGGFADASLALPTPQPALIFSSHSCRFHGGRKEDSTFCSRDDVHPRRQLALARPLRACGKESHLPTGQRGLVSRRPLPSTDLQPAGDCRMESPSINSHSV